MSETNEEFGGWQKQRRQYVWRPKEGHPYEVALDEPAYTAKHTGGSSPELLDTVPIGDDDKGALRTAQHVCESHWRKQQATGAKLGVATALVWTRDKDYDGELYTAPGVDGLTYACEEDESHGAGPRWYAAIGDGELGDHETLELAQAACQLHRDTEAGTSDVKPENQGKPERELREWSIPVPLSDQEFEAKSRQLASATTEIGRDTIEIARVKEQAKRTVKDLEEAIGVATKESLELAEIVEARAEHRLVKCQREVADGEEIYTDPDSGEEIHRAALPDQGQLWGGDKPPPEPPSKGVQLLEELEAAIKRAFDEQTPEAITAAGDAIDAAAAHLQGEQLKELRARHAEAAAAKPADPLAKTDPLPADVPLTKADFRKLSSGAYVTSGEPHYRAEKNDNGLWQVLFGVDGAESWRELPGSHKRLRDAIEQAAADNVTRLRWTPVPGDSTQLFAGGGAYQVREARGGKGYLAYHGETLLAGDATMDRAEAQAACQAHADGGRAGQ